MTMMEPRNKLCRRTYQFAVVCTVQKQPKCSGLHYAVEPLSGSQDSLEVAESIGMLDVEIINTEAKTNFFEQEILIVIGAVYKRRSENQYQMESAHRCIA
ncbi:hypothetical protein AVEN_256507-1 [Araneus ventricosus]|uniref:Uncharacterized protein n=1 Tax=Araneus ventricosus TaxID=182803 RepID=A0A4Y2QV92_ARAVE|nr:hypothetical protein AVEN_256507-1 [Araneus ventricosus]